MAHAEVAWLKRKLPSQVETASIPSLVRKIVLSFSLLVKWIQQILVVLLLKM
jgi:hypothetical protein